MASGNPPWPWYRDAHRTSKGQAGAISSGGSEAVQMSVNVVGMEECDIEDPVVDVAVIITATFGLEDVDLGAVVANDYSGEGVLG